MSTAKLDIIGLESEDLETLARMIQLAGQAETKPLDGVEFEEPQVDLEIVQEPELGIEAELPVSIEPLDEPIDDLSTDELSHITRMSGLQEKSIDSTEELEDAIFEEQLLPDLSLDESSPEGLSTAFDSEEAAIIDAQNQTNGIKDEHFIIIPRDGEYFWKRIVHESEAEFYNDEGIRNSRHEVKTKSGVALGDNGLEDRSDDDVNGIFESLQERYKKFIGE